ncbi:hypothetical protein MMC09_003044 [Bachmanniomyces sp. S44760]|nr:hypothetical protein [Bachmanniomyces sp. S44760]
MENVGQTMQGFCAIPTVKSTQAHAALNMAGVATLLLIAEVAVFLGVLRHHLPLPPKSPVPVIPRVEIQVMEQPPQTAPVALQMGTPRAKAGRLGHAALNMAGVAIRPIIVGLAVSLGVLRHLPTIHHHQQPPKNPFLVVPLAEVQAMGHLPQTVPVVPHTAT